MSARPPQTNAQAAAMARLADELEQAESWTPVRRRRRQNELLGQLLEHAAASVPLYREAATAALADPDGGSPLERLVRMPVITRRTLQERSAEMLSRAAMPDGAVSFTTSGSTGSPVTVSWNMHANLIVRALVARFHRWHKSDHRAKLAGLRAVDTPGGRTQRGRDWYPDRPGGVTADTDAAQPVREQLRWLQRERPRYLLTYPSNARALLLAAREKRVRMPGLARIDTFGETMDEGLPALAREVWGVAVADRYSAREVGMIAFQCPEAGSYHVQAESVIVELLDEDGAPVAPGTPGRVVVTNLFNRAMPIIRYAIGDYAEAGPPCACGRSLPVLRSIRGRARNMFRLPDGDVLWPRFNSDDLARAAPLRQFQLIQKSLELVQVRLVVSRAVSADEEAALEAMIRARLPGDFRIELEYVDHIPRGAGGKYEDFRSELADDAGGTSGG